MHKPATVSGTAMTKE